MSWDLVADIGGTHIRIARAISGKIYEKVVSPTGGAGSVVEALRAYAVEIGTFPERVKLAAAGPVVDGIVALTNGQEIVDPDAIAQSLGGAKTSLINDFEAAAWALASVTADDITALHGDRAPPPGHRIILGAGTGLGVGMLVQTSKGYQAIPGEGGHVGIIGQSAFERAVFSELARLWPQIEMTQGSGVLEAEGVVSGTGLPKLYMAAQKVLGEQANSKTSLDLFAAKDVDKAAAATVEIFKRHLAQVAGNLAVSVTATGGVFFAGGVAQANPWLFDDAFCVEFAAGGRFTSLRQTFPLYLYDNAECGLIGAANALTLG